MMTEAGRIRIMKGLLIAAAVVGFAALVAPVFASDVRVIDGDTFDLGGQRIRLCGIDAPEMGTFEGEASKRALIVLLRGKDVHCLPVGQGTPCDHKSPKTSHKRIVAQCWANGEDIAAAMVRLGEARDWPKFSGGYYGR